MTLPYASATTGARAREDIVKMLKQFGCESVGFMDEFNTRSLILAFRWRDQNCQLRASAQGWANAYLKKNPWSSRRRYTRQEWEQKALEQGLIAINSILRDWVKGQVTAIETGILSFEAVFMPYMLDNQGVPLIERAQKLLEKPEKGDA